MRYHWLFSISLLLFILFASGCAQGTGELRPPEIHYGEDLCAECNMIISDPRFAAAYAHEISTGRYEQFAFDDIGNMLLHASKHPEYKIAGWYVHDYQTEEWIDATHAHYVVSDAIATPMGYGIAAFASEQNAQTLAAETGGELFTWDALRARAQKAPVPMHQHSPDHASPEHGEEPIGEHTRAQVESQHGQHNNTK